MGGKVLDRRGDQRRILGRADVLDGHAQELFLRIAVVAHRGLVDGEERQRLDVVQPHRQRAVLEEEAVVHLGSLEAGVLLLDLLQHLVEGPSQHPQLVVGPGFHPHRVVRVAQHLVCSVGQVRDGLEDPALDTVGDPERGDQGHQQDRGGEQQVLPDAAIALDQAGFQDHCPERGALADHRHAQHQAAVPEAVPGRGRKRAARGGNRRRLPIARERPALAVEHASGADPGLGPQRLEGSGCCVRVVEEQRRRDAEGQHLRVRGEVSHQQPAEGDQLVSEESRAGEEQRQAAGEGAQGDQPAADRSGSGGHHALSAPARSGRRAGRPPAEAASRASISPGGQRRR